MNKWPTEDKPKVTVWNFLAVVFIASVTVAVILAVVAPYAGQ
jgi:hypothetical protein